jgi:uncharacterized membrane protein YphA (DoxX/SURF4 family)
VRIAGLIARVLFGGLFIWASYDKVLNPEPFAQIVYNYQIVPDVLVNAVAIFLPWIELVAGVCLVLGVFGPGAALILNALVVVFIAALAYNMARGLEISCGCFSTAPTEGGSMAMDIVRDIVILALGVFAFIAELRRRARARR